MSLRKILTHLSAEHGIDLNNPEEKLYLIEMVNDAAEEVWSNVDLPSSLREQFFSFAEKEEIITLPWYVSEIRGMRRPCWSDKDPITLHDLRPRYHLNSWGDVRVDQWRIIGEKPIKQNIDNILPLTFKTATPEKQPVTFTVRGRNLSGSSRNLTATLEIGQVEVTLPNDFAEIEYISKDALTDNTVNVYSGATLIAEIMCNMSRSRYVAVQVADNCLRELVGCECGKIFVEVLYKPTYVPMYADDDNFQITGYDKVVELRTSEWLTKDKDSRAIYSSKADQQLERRANNQQMGKQTKVNFGRNVILDTYDNYMSGHYMGYPSEYPYGPRR